MTAADAGGAFVTKRVDAAVTWEPWLSNGKTAAFGHLLVDSSTTPGLIIDVIVVKTAGRARTRRLSRPCRAWNAAVDYYGANPEERIAIMAKVLGGWLKDPKDFKPTLTGMEFYGGQAQAFFGTKAKPGQLDNTAGGDRHLVQPRPAEGQADAGRLINYSYIGG